MVVTTTTPPSAIVEVNVDVTGFNEGDDVKVGLLVIGVEAADWSVYPYLSSDTPRINKRDQR